MAAPALLICLALTQAAGPPIDVQPAAALADARSRLRLVIGECRLADRQTVADILGDASDDSALELLAIDAAPANGGRNYQDGVFAIHLTLDRAALVKRLRQAMRNQGLPGDEIKRHLSALRANLPPSRLTVAGLAASPEAAGGVPIGWRTLGSPAVELAAECAILDARRRLVDAMGRLRLADGRRISELFTLDPAIEMELIHAIPGHAFARPVPTLERRCRIDARLTRSDIAALFAGLAEARPHGIGPRKTKLGELEPAEQDPDEVFVQGVGVLPSPEVMVRLGLIAPDVWPRWADDSITVEGNHALLRVVSNRGSALTTSIAAAEKDARAKLGRRIHALRVRRGVTVADVVAPDRPLAAGVSEFLAGAHRVRNPTIADDRVTVTLRLPLRRLWHLVRERGRPSGDVSREKQP